MFLDTFANDWNNAHNFPHVSAMVSNGDLTYNHDKDGIDEAIGKFIWFDLIWKDYFTYTL